MALEARTNFLGLPVEGDDPIFNRTNSSEQLGEDEFSALLTPLIESETIEAVRWRQYTPYFNDGDICEFSIGEPTFKLVGIEVEDGDSDWEDGFLDTWDWRIKGGQQSEYVTDGSRWGGKWQKTGPVLPQHADYDAMVALSDKIYMFDNYLYDAFGDHAVITVYKTRIEVEFYSHD